MLLKRDFQKAFSALHREMKFQNFETAHNFGLVFDATDEADYHRVESFARHLQTKDKKVKAIGFVGYKETPHYIMPKLSYDYVTLKDLGFSYNIKNPLVREFMDFEFDILIDFNLKRNPILRYISGLSKAKFKIGRYHEEDKEIFDFMLQDISAEHLAQYAKEVFYYLELLHTKDYDK